jgi:hypothetical protein
MSCPIFSEDLENCSQIHILCYNVPHTLCDTCYKSINDKCPLCRTNIILKHKIKNMKNNNTLIITNNSKIDTIQDLKNII